MRDLHRCLFSMPFPGVVITRRDTPHAELVAIGFPDDLGTGVAEERDGGRVEWWRVLYATMMFMDPTNKTTTYQPTWRKNSSSEMRSCRCYLLLRRSFRGVVRRVERDELFLTSEQAR